MYTMTSQQKQLSILREGQKGIVVALAGGRDFQDRIISMGIVPGCEIEMMKNGLHSPGPVLIGVGDSRIMLGRGMTQKIMVELDNTP
jgi:ferrous iron transport protein A